MKYNTVKVVPERSHDCWRVLFEKDDTDRHRTKTLPNAFGFYHYPATMNKNVALKKLLACMRKAHLKEIKELTKSLENLTKSVEKLICLDT